MGAENKSTLIYAIAFVRDRLGEQRADLVSASTDEISAKWRSAVDNSTLGQLNLLRELDYHAPRPHIRSDDWLMARDVVRCLAAPFFEHPDAPDDDFWVT